MVTGANCQQVSECGLMFAAPDKVQDLINYQRVIVGQFEDAVLSL
jgi:hypothetical protein